MLNKPASLVMDWAEVSCWQCSWVLLSPGCWFQPSSFVYHYPVQPWMETRMHWWCNPSLWSFAVVQNPSPSDHCWILALSLKDFSKRNPEISTHVHKPPFLSMDCSLLYPSMVSSFPAALGCTVFPSDGHPSHSADSTQAFPQHW